LRVNLSDRNVEDDVIEELLERHAPGQLEMALAKLPSASAINLVRIIRSGRFGYRRGFKKLLTVSQAPPKVPAPVPIEEAKCLHAQRQALQELQQHYLGEIP